MARIFWPMHTHCRANKGASGVVGSRWAELLGDRAAGFGGVVEWHPRGVGQQDVQTTTGAAGDDPEVRWRREATRHSHDSGSGGADRAKLVLEPITIVGDGRRTGNRVPMVTGRSEVRRTPSGKCISWFAKATQMWWMPICPSTLTPFRTLSR